MIGHSMFSSYKQNCLEVAQVSTVPLDVLTEEVEVSLRQKYPDLTVVNLAQNVSADGINYRSGMIIVREFNGGLPDFEEIVQVCFERWTYFHSKENKIILHRTLQILQIGSFSK